MSPDTPRVVGTAGPTDGPIDRLLETYAANDARPFLRSPSPEQACYRILSNADWEWSAPSLYRRARQSGPELG